MTSFSVTELTNQIQELLEGNFRRISVRGELSNWKVAPSGHAYFSLKDDKALLQAVMFRSRMENLYFAPLDGMSVTAVGTVSVYQARGQYQLIVDTLSLSGKGNIQKELDDRKKRLAAEGLFDLDKKKPLPAFPEQIAVITSPRGAAVHDVIKTLSRRAPHIRITILPALMQGDECPQEIMRMLKCANKQKLGEVIIIARGGGSVEDLFAFSDENLVRAVAASKIPVISAIGHETDWSLCDYAADLRAPTPTAAAELVSESTAVIVARYTNAKYACISSIKGRVQSVWREFEQSNTESIILRIERQMESHQQRLDYATSSLKQAASSIVQKSFARFRTASTTIEAASPALILSRGYAIIRNSDNGHYITDVSEAKEAETIAITFKDGEIEAAIMEVTK